jgi:molybdopterin molybdotransferase
VAVIATGDEIVAPGKPLPGGKLYASNMVEICSWLSVFGMGALAEVAGDRGGEILSAIRKHLAKADAFVTSGGIWGSERDLMTGVLKELQWKGIYHRVKMGPGKAVAFGLLEGKPFFCLPGGPPSNEMAFLQLALPGILALAGRRAAPFPVLTALLTETVKGDKSWTQFVHARLVGGEEIRVRPEKLKSRLQSMARKEAIIKIPEGAEVIAEGEEIPVQVLIPLVQPHGIFTKLIMSGSKQGSHT